MLDTPETETLAEMETPVEITQDEMNDSRFSYDLPGNNSVKANESENEAISANSSSSDTNTTDVSDASEEDSNSEIPGDPRSPHQTQPPTQEQF